MNQYATIRLEPYTTFYVGELPCVILPTREGQVLAHPIIQDGVASATMSDLERLAKQHRAKRRTRVAPWREQRRQDTENG